MKELLILIAAVVLLALLMRKRRENVLAAQNTGGGGVPPLQITDLTADGSIDFPTNTGSGVLVVDGAGNGYMPLYTPDTPDNGGSIELSM